MPQKKTVAIIGAGPSGLTAIKACKEEGLEPFCFEKNGEPGGLWRYHDEDIEGVASVMRTTIINTSKEMSAFSDFPPPKEFANYMHNSKMYQYFLLYAEHFDLLKHIRYHMEVVKVEQTLDYDETGRWKVSALNSQTNEVFEDVFDAVMICIGHHVYPKIPTFQGQEKFKGSIVHTHSLKNCDGYKNQKVVVVGIGNSGVDAAVDCTYVADKVYLSTRRGCWILGRVGKHGKPFDLGFLNRKNVLLGKLCSFDQICDKMEKELNEKFDHAVYKLKPKHRIFSAHPTLNDAIPNCILSGKIIIKGDINHFEENGIVFEGEDEVTEADAVILATGYYIRFPFIDESVLSFKENHTHLYKYAIPSHLKHPTLILIGLIQPLGAIFPISELQSRWFGLLLTGKVKLPSKEKMEKDIFRKNEANAKRYVASTRHTIQVDYIPFMDELAELIGAKPNLLKLAITDPKLFKACLFAPCFPYQYRLQGPHAWPGARDAILNYKERINYPLNTRRSTTCNDDVKQMARFKSWFLYAVPLMMVLFWHYAFAKEKWF